MAQFQNPEDSRVPVAPLHVILERGLDANKVPCCAVEEDGKIIGCKQAKRCQEMLRGHAKLPWTPKSGMAGTGGEGPENVAWYRRDAVSRSERMDYMPCHQAVVTLYDDWRQQAITGNKVEILGGPGTRIVTQRRVEVDPNCNKTGDTRMKMVTEEIAVPEHAKLDIQTPTLEYVEKMAAIRDRMAQQAAFVADFVDEQDAAAEVHEAGQAPVVEAAPVKRGRGKAAR